MRLPDGRWLGYCTNVHAYGDLAGLLVALREHAVPLRAALVADGRLGADESLGVGLWLPDAVARELERDVSPLADALAETHLHAFTLNAFPQGAFHAERVKDDVFRPSWAEASRLEYTLRCAEVLARLLPSGATGSISTHTGAHKSWGPATNDAATLARGFLAAADGLAALEDRTGVRVQLALEPEPFSFVETTEEVVAFFARHLLVSDAARRHLGLCYDACHQAVEFEDMGGSLGQLHDAGVSLAKVQLSSALVLPEPARHRALLQPFAEDRWFHQVVLREGDGALRRIADLPDALADEAAASADEWRVHFHVPLFADPLDDEGRLRTTRPDLAALLAALPADRCAHLEIETYSFDAIPAERRAALGTATLGQALRAEFAWVLDELGVR